MTSTLSGATSSPENVTLNSLNGVKTCFQSKSLGIERSPTKGKQSARTGGWYKRPLLDWSKTVKYNTLPIQHLQDPRLFGRNADKDLFRPPNAAFGGVNRKGASRVKYSRMEGRATAL